MYMCYVPFNVEEMFHFKTYILKKEQESDNLVSAALLQYKGIFTKHKSVLNFILHIKSLE